ncbi:fibronectin type III domain-containing protein [Caldicellulosiruptor morganii]|uniref:Fibronectin type III domain-containing protein n=1 Tax=Caldicellulosiruptor morganii TaxID=1387555 RepID=A0ABY7BPM2_9FIRM|nr:fibronectin type III domain-containing protein [Caldicellulosiruptor morganii]WAM34499.1 fibronectin type III domain-containing protein [Caldicellulosiruptor morganii]
MNRIFKKIIVILCIVGLFISNLDFSVQGFSQTLSSWLNLMVMRDSNGVYMITKNSITVKWNAIEDAATYQVSAASSNTQIDFSTVTANTYCDVTGLKPATVYKCL